jgi:hypothetical protein
VTLWVIAGFSGANLQADEEAATGSDYVRAADLKEQNDGTILNRRVCLETEWNKFRDGTSTVEETLGSLWSWRVSEKPGLGGAVETAGEVSGG